MTDNSEVKIAPRGPERQNPDRSKLNVRFTVSPHVRQASDDDGLVLLDLRTGRYLTFNPVGSVVWTQIEKGASLAGIIQHLQKAFNVSYSILERDVQSLLTTLETAGLVQNAVGQAVGGDAGASRPRVKAKGGRKSGSVPLRFADMASLDSQSARVGFFKASFWNVLSFLTLAYIDLIMKAFGLRGVYYAVSTRRSMSDVVDAAMVERICSSMNRAAAAYFKRAWCLQRSAACVYLLRRCGCPANLVLGVRTFPFEAHAWAELRGEIINDTEDYVQKFLVLDRI